METRTCLNCKETKPINKFRIHHTKCNTCFNKAATYREVTELPDYYVIKCLTRKRKISKSDVTPQDIINHRNFMLLKREAKSLSGKKLCWNCKTIKDKSEFPLANGACLECKRFKRKVWKKNNPEKVRIQVNRKLLEHSLVLSDLYIVSNIRKTLNQNYNLEISNTDIPQEFIDLKRKELTLKRQIQHGKNNKSS